MAFTVPRKDVAEISANPIPGVRQQIDAPAMAFGDGGAALRQGSQALNALSDMANKHAVDEMETQAAARTLELSNLARRELNKFIYDPEGGLLTRKGGAAQSARADTETFLTELQQRYTNMQGESPRVLEMLRGEMSKISDTGMDLAERHQFTELTSYRDEQLRSRVTNNMEEQALNFNDETRFNQIQADTRDAVLTQARTQGWSPEKTQQELSKALSTARSAQFTAMVNQDKPESTMLAYQAFQEARRRGQIGFEESMKLDSMFDAAMPKAAAQVAMGQLRGGSLPSSDDAIKFVMHELEGGAQTVQDGGGIARFGINSVANPDVDVANLTEEQAKQIYQTDYWNKIVDPAMSPQMQIAAFDTAVNHGVPKAQTLIRQANGNPARLLQLRLDEYNRLATENPEKYGSQLAGWKNRLRDLQTKIGEVSTASVSAADVNTKASQLDLQYPGAGAELLALYKRQNEALDTARKADRQALLDQVMPTLYANNGDWTQLPPEVRTRAMQNGAWEDITKFSGVSDPNAKVALASMSPEQLATTDLSQYRLRLSQADYLSFTEKQRDSSDPAKASGMRTIQQQITAAADALSLTGAKGDPVKEMQFRDRAEAALDAAKIANGDKPLTREQVRATIGSLMLDTTAGKMYQVRPNQVADVVGPGWSRGDIPIADAQNSALALSYLGFDITNENVVDFSNSPAKFLGITSPDDRVREAITMLARQGMSMITPAQIQRYIQATDALRPTPPIGD